MLASHAQTGQYDAKLAMLQLRQTAIIQPTSAVGALLVCDILYVEGDKRLSSCTAVSNAGVAMFRYTTGILCILVYTAGLED